MTPRNKTWCCRIKVELPKESNIKRLFPKLQVLKAPAKKLNFHSHLIKLQRSLPELEKENEHVHSHIYEHTHVKVKDILHSYNHHTKGHE